MDSDSYIDEDDDYAGFGEAAAEKPSFREGDLKYAQSRMNSEFKIELLAFIKNLPITYRLKRDYYSFVHASFCPEQVLANNNPRAESRFIKSDPLLKKLLAAELRLRMVTACVATKSDAKKINIGLLEKEILDSFEAYITRTIGSDREGIRNSIIATEATSRTEKPRGDGTIIQKKKTGILNFGGD